MIPASVPARTRTTPTFRHFIGFILRYNSPQRIAAADEELWARARLYPPRETVNTVHVIRSAVWRKEMKHYVNDPGFQPASRSMSQIGG